jgi:hypothetical protein
VIACVCRRPRYLLARSERCWVCRCPSNLLASGAARTQAAIDMHRPINRSALSPAHLGQYVRSIKAKLWSRVCGFQSSIVEVIILCTISIGLSLGHRVTLGELDIRYPGCNLAHVTGYQRQGLPMQYSLIMGVSISIVLYEAKVEIERFAKVEKERSC